AAVLDDVRWDYGYILPKASPENEALEDKLQKLQAEAINLQNELANSEERAEAMLAHLKNVTDEFSFSQSLYKARQNEIETEQHFRFLSEREYGHLKNESKQLEDDMVSLRDKKNSQENAINKTTKKLENLKQQMNCDEEVLERWIEELDCKANDAITIQKYIHQDEGKVGALTLQVEKLTIQAKQKRRALDNEFTESTTAQIEHDQTAEYYCRVHQERQEVIKLWESAVQQMQKRDQQIDRCGLLITEIKHEIRNKKIMLEEKKSFMVNEKLNNLEYENKISSADRGATSLQDEYQIQDSLNVQLQDELDALKSAVERTASDLESLRTDVASLKEDIQKKQARLSFLNEKNTSLANKMKLMTKTLSSEDKCLRMEEILKEEEKNVKEKETEINQLKELLLKKTEELKVQKDMENCVLAETEGSRRSLKNLKSQLHRVDVDALNQEEFIYNQDFEIQQLQRQLSQLEGEVNADEDQDLKAEVAELKKTLEERKNAYNILHEQHNKLQSNASLIKKAMEKTGEEISGMKIELNELNLFNERSDQELQNTRATKQELMVEDNLLKVQLKRLQDTLCNTTEKVLTVNKQNLDLEKAIAERAEEIKNQKAMLDSQLRLVDKEQQCQRAECQDCRNKTDQLRCRYEILIDGMMPSEEEEENPHNYYAKKASQEREALQREHDDLDTKLRKAERETPVVEDTMQQIITCVSKHRNFYKEVAETYGEREEKLKLEEEKRAAAEKYRCKQRQNKELQENLQSMENDIDTVLKQEALFQKQKEGKQDLNLELDKGLEEQRIKLERATKQCSRLSREIQSVSDTETEESDTDLHELKDFNKTIDNLLADVLETKPDLTTPFQMHF
ncbi:CCD39 protein, partial [Galbula dea]|nr:CCD39 protein [Galbula dea]